MQAELEEAKPAALEASTELLFSCLAATKGNVGKDLGEGEVVGEGMLLDLIAGIGVICLTVK